MHCNHHPTASKSLSESHASTNGTNMLQNRSRLSLGVSGDYESDQGADNECINDQGSSDDDDDDDDDDVGTPVPNSGPDTRESSNLKQPLRCSSSRYSNETLRKALLQTPICVHIRTDVTVREEDAGRHSASSTATIVRIVASRNGDSAAAH